MMQTSCLEQEEIRRVEGTWNQSSSFELAERRKDEGTRMQSSCLEQEEEKRRNEKQRCREMREQGCRTVA